MSRQRGARRPPDRFAGVTGPGGASDVPVFITYGTACNVFHDAEVTAALESGGHLLQSANGATVDRYDARLLLDPAADTLSQLRSRGALADDQAASGDDEPEEALDAERYADLGCSDSPGSSSNDADPPAPADAPPGRGRPTPGGAGAYREVSFTYAGSGVADDAGGEPGGGAVAAAVDGHLGEAPQFVPRFDVAIPERLVARLPRSAREQKIMAQTARFVREAGGQAEFVLRVRQAANPAFAFLAHGDRCHAYFRWLLDVAPRELPDEPQQSAPAVTERPSAPAGPTDSSSAPAAAEPSALQSLHVYADALDADSRGPLAIQLCRRPSTAEHPR
ncbi:hypothetical protein WJX81_005320 [Elliptochloris bilobata]|uniref:SURP motif domain-containing protein n=1 Tax=Elliptochloris bilobata TaxID=381761 RepID=A0AAW1QN31_9CHLO